MTLALESRKVLIAGTTGGVGSAVARAAADSGARVLLLGRDAAELERLRTSIEESGGQAYSFVADATDGTAVEAAVRSLRRQAGGIDGIVNAVGVNTPRRDLDDLSEEDWRLLFDVNVTSAFLLQRSILPILRAEGGGDIIHIASTAARDADGSGAAYQASKAALAGLARATTREAGPDGVRVCTIYPGFIDTGFARHRPRPPSLHERERALQPEDVAAVCMTVLGLPSRAHVSEVVMAPSV